MTMITSAFCDVTKKKNISEDYTSLGYFFVFLGELEVANPS
jgi:hypothetical protein